MQPTMNCHHNDVACFVVDCSISVSYYRRCLRYHHYDVVFHSFVHDLNFDLMNENLQVNFHVTLPYSRLRHHHHHYYYFADIDVDDDVFSKELNLDPDVIFPKNGYECENIHHDCYDDAGTYHDGCCDCCTIVVHYWLIKRQYTINVVVL